MRPPPHKKMSKVSKRISFNTFLILLLSICTILYFSLSVRIHSQLHQHHRNSVEVVVSSDSSSRLKSGQRAEVQYQSAKQNQNAKTSTSNNSNINKERGLAACLLVNDENPRLPEWLAYHYHILPLRALIITVDPSSRSSPIDILDRWKGMIDVTIWDERDYLPEVDSHGNKIGYGRCVEGLQKTESEVSYLHIT